MQQELIDEHATSLFVRIVNRMFEALESVRETVTKDELLPALRYNNINEIKNDKSFFK